MNPPAAAGQRPSRATAATAAATYEVENLRIENKGLCSGQMSHGVRSGRGTMVYNNGARYERDWILHKQHGEGKIEWRNGKSYNGNWLYGKYHGRGVWTRIDGSSFERVWSDGHLVRRMSQEPEADEMEAELEPEVEMEEAIEMEEVLEMEAESDAEMDEEQAVEPDVEVAMEEALAADAPVNSPVRPVVNAGIVDYLDSRSYAITCASVEEQVIISGGVWKMRHIKTLLEKIMIPGGRAYIYLTVERCPNSAQGCVPVFAVILANRHPTITVCTSDGTNILFDEVGFQWTEATNSVWILTSSSDLIEPTPSLYFATPLDFGNTGVDQVKFTIDGQTMTWDESQHGSWTSHLKCITNDKISHLIATGVDVGEHMKRNISKKIDKEAKVAWKRANQENSQKALESCLALAWERDMNTITRYIQNRRIMKVYPMNSQATMIPEFKEKYICRLLRWLGDPKAVSNHYLEDPGLKDNPAIERRRLNSLWKRLEGVDWKTTKSPSVLLGTCVIGDYIFATRLRWSGVDDLCKQLVTDYGLWSILQFIGCKDIEDANLESFEALVHRVSFEFVKTCKSYRINGRYPKSTEELICHICYESMDSDLPFTSGSTIEVENIQLDKQNFRCIEVQFKSCLGYRQISAERLRGFVRTPKALADAFLALFCLGGKPLILPPGARNDDVKCGVKRKQEEEGPNCMVNCVRLLPDSAMSPSAKGRFNKKIKTCGVQMISGAALQRLFDECIRSTSIGSRITKNIKKRAMEDTGVVMFAVCVIEGSSVKHCILIDSTEARTRTRDRENGVMIDPEKEFGVYPRNYDTCHKLEIQEITELYEVRKVALNEASRVKLSTDMPEYNWSS